MTRRPEPRMESAPPMLLAGIRRQHTMADAAASVPEQWREFRAVEVPNAVGGRAYGAYCATTDDGFEYLTGVEVETFDGLPAGLGRMRLPAQRYAVFTHEGNVSEVGAVWQHIWRDWLPQAPFEDAETPPFERYDTGFDPDTGEGGFEIWFPVRDA